MKITSSAGKAKITLTKAESKRLKSGTMIVTASTVPEFTSKILADLMSLSDAIGMNPGCSPCEKIRQATQLVEEAMGELGGEVA